MLLTGYHGTNRVHADQITSGKMFKASSTDKEWLGTGIYFFERYEDALLWNRGSSDVYADAVMHAIIKLEDDEYLDLDLANGKLIYDAIIKNLAKSGHTITGDISARTCLIMNLIWDSCKRVQVLAASFPTEEQAFTTLFDYRKKRREFCVRNNKSIKSIVEVERVI